MVKLSKFVNEVIKNFFIIFGSIIIIITLLRQFFYPDLAFDLKSIYILILFSLVGALTGFILYTSNDVSEKNMRIRIVVHFCALEVILISLGITLGVVDSALSILTFAVQIAVIYVIVHLLSWQNDKREVKQINEKLLLLKKNK